MQLLARDILHWIELLANAWDTYDEALPINSTMPQEAWSVYEQHAFGYDELAPLSLSGTNEQGGIGMMILESLGTLKMMKLEDEFERYRNYPKWFSKECKN